MYLNVGIWDEGQKTKNDKPMGSATFEIGDVLGSRGNIKAKQLKSGGLLFMRVVHDTTSQTLYVSSASGRKLANVEGGLFGKSDPFFEFAVQQEGPGGKTWYTVYRSSHIKDTLNPQWDGFQIDVDQLLREGDTSKNASQTAIKVTIFDHESSGKHEFMGSFETTVGAILGSGATFTVKSRRGKPAGTFEIKNAAIREDGGSSSAPTPNIPTGVPRIPFASKVPLPSSRRPTFVDYISGSCVLNMCVAIDFTGSNGDPRKPGTLHYIHQDNQLNDYEKAITAIGGIISKYDSDQKYPVYGFGAKFYGQLYHCFLCGGGIEVSGVGGILQAYRSTFSEQLTLSGPTLFQEVIQTAASNATAAHEEAQRKGKQAYSVLLILTDGAVSDVNATKNALIAASSAPLSVVIIGVGNADFSAMQFLDDFRAPPPSNDIAQFVEFRRYAHDKRALTEATLEEIPAQLVNYFTSRNIYPTPMESSHKLNVVPDPYNQETDIDLTLDFKPNDEVEIDISATPGVYDYHRYDTSSQYFTPPSMSPNAPPPMNPSMLQQMQPPAKLFSHSQAHPSAPPMTSRPSSAGVSPMALPVQQPSSVFRVQVPTGVHSGQQLRVQNPFTGQPVVVTVPHGMSQGAVFEVSTS